MVELLAPAGDFESLKAAVLNGANAVYIGGKSFSARQFANNFDDDEMVKAVRFCHAYGVKLYVTMNTLLNNSELEEAVSYASFLYRIGIDAVIIQDIGLLKELRENLPDLEIHGSTQMTVHNLEGVNLLYSMGVKRVVLSRELSMDEIEHITSNTAAEIEVFIHGALCISFSGQCLMSSIIGGRSGNRGKCAQPCRMKYSIDEGDRAYFLSPKDLSTLDFIEDVISKGVVSLKIEGRMKRPEYVATVVAAYRRAIDGMSRADDIEKVTQIFNRGGFTPGYFKGRQGKEMMSPKRPKNWGTYLGKVVSTRGRFASVLLEKPLNIGDGVEIFGKDLGAPVTSIKVNNKDVKAASPREVAAIYLEGAELGDIIYKSLDINLINEAEESYKGKEVLKVPVKGRFIAHINSSIRLEIDYKNTKKIEVLGDEPEIAIKTPTTIERVKESLIKTGDTSFYFEDLEIEMDDNLAIPASKINKLRREGFEKLLELLQDKREFKDININYNVLNKKTVPKIAVKTGRLDVAKACIDAGCDLLYFGGDNLRINKGNIIDAINYGKGRIKVYPWYPEIIIEEWDKLKEDADFLFSNGVDGALCGNLGFYNHLISKGFKVSLDKGFNIFNSYACETFKNEGCILSQELTFPQIRDLTARTENKTMLQVHGRIKLMVNRNCIIGSAKGHGREGCPTLCSNSCHYIKDRMGEDFLTITDFYCRSHIYNSKILCTIENMRDILKLNVDTIILNFVDESYEKAALTVSAYREALLNASNGDFKLGDMGNNLIKELKNNITKGHFLRGVE